MIKYKVPKSQSDENLPLLFFTDVEEEEGDDRLITKSDIFRSRHEWTISTDSGRMESSDTRGHDLAELSNCQGIIHIIKASIGTGVLALPSALRYSGILLGSLAILFLSIVSIYSMRLLLRVVAHLRQTDLVFIQNLDYEKTVQLCFEKSTAKWRRYSWLHHVLYGSLVVAEMGFLSSYHIFVAENSKALIDNYITESSYILPLWAYQIIFAFLLSPLLFVKTLKRLSYFSQLANVLMVMSLLISLVYCLQDPLPIQSLKLIKLSDATPLFFGIVIFSFESINLINPVECHLKKKKNILDTFGVINVATSIVLVVYLIIGVCGYWKFGDNIGSSLILSIPLQPWYYMLCKPFYVVSVVISYALQGYVMFQILWKKLETKFSTDRTRIVGASGIRVGIVMTTMVLSIAIPHFDLFISLVGAFSGASITLIFPSICHSVIVLSTKDGRYWRVQLCVNALIFALGIVGCVLGTYSSVVNIVKALSK